MNKLPPAILLDLDDTILSAFGQAEGQWQRVIAEFIEHLAPHPPDDIVAAVQAYSRFLWADQARHKHWRHRNGEARRHIVQNAFAERCGKSGQPAPSGARWSARYVSGVPPDPPSRPARLIRRLPESLPQLVRAWTLMRSRGRIDASIIRARSLAASLSSRVASRRHRLTLLKRHPSKISG